MVLEKKLREKKKRESMLSLLRQLELLGKHRFALLVLVRDPGFWESDAARSLLRQQLSHSFPHRDQNQEYDESLETVQQIRQDPDEKEFLDCS